MARDPEEVETRIFHEYADLPGTRVLEIGCGEGRLLWRTGPLGGLHLRYTPGAIVLAQVVLALPLIAALTLAAVQLPARTATLH